MSNLHFSIKQEIAILNKYKINPTELFVLRLLLIAQDDEEDESLYEFLSLPEDCRGSLRQILESLRNKGIINKSFKLPNSGEEINLLEIPINKTITKSLYKSAFEMGEELFAAYPQWCYINGKAVALRSISKKFNTPEDAFRYYGKCIGWNPEKHNSVIELLKWAKDKDIINFSLSSFIVDRRWLDLEAMKEGKISNICFDSFTDI